MIPLTDDELSTIPPNAAAEIRHHREHVTRLQTRCSELTLAERAARGVLQLRWKRIGEHSLPVPSRAHDSDAGLDLAVIADLATAEKHGLSWSREPLGVVVWPEATLAFRTGWAVAIPPGWFGLIVPRSSTGKAGWDIESSGVIDSGYRGEIMLPLIYRGAESVRVEHGQRMAQMLILPVPRIDSIVVDELDGTARGAGGFGSSGQ